MIKNILIMSLFLFSSFSYATCYNNNIHYAPPINVDLSDKLSPATPVWITTIPTQYAGSFNCTTYESTFGYIKILSTSSHDATVLSFNEGKYNIRAEITNNIPNLTIKKWGSYSAAQLNTSMTIKFSLVSQKGEKIQGNTANLRDILIVTDLSGLSFFEILLWLPKQILKIAYWLLNGFQWPYDQRDMYSQPMNITYSPKMTTCLFQNAGLVVSLPTLGRNQVLNDTRAGYTPFNLNMRCENLGNKNTSERDIDIFLSSNNLLSTDHTVLIDKSTNAAQGVGLRLVKTNDSQQPVVISTNTNNRGTATSLFYVKAGGQLEPNFIIPMAAYYYAWSPKQLTQGTIKTTAILNVVYP